MLSVSREVYMYEPFLPRRALYVSLLNRLGFKANTITNIDLIPNTSGGSLHLVVSLPEAVVEREKIMERIASFSDSVSIFVLDACAYELKDFIRVQPARHMQRRESSLRELEIGLREFLGA